MEKYVDFSKLVPLEDNDIQQIINLDEVREVPPEFNAILQEVLMRG